MTNTTSTTITTIVNDRFCKSDEHRTDVTQTSRLSIAYQRLLISIKRHAARHLYETALCVETRSTASHEDREAQQEAKRTENNAHILCVASQVEVGFIVLNIYDVGATETV